MSQAQLIRRFMWINLRST